MILALALSVTANAYEARGKAAGEREKSPEARAAESKNAGEVDAAKEGKMNLEERFLSAEDKDLVKDIRAIAASGDAGKKAMVDAFEAFSKATKYEPGQKDVERRLRLEDVKLASNYDAADLKGFTDYLNKAADIATKYRRANGKSMSANDAWEKALNVEVTYDNEKTTLLKAWEKCMKRSFPI